MILTPDQTTKVIERANSYLGTAYRRNFDCIGFIRAVFNDISITIPKLNTGYPPQKFNIRKEEVGDLPIGHIMFLTDRKDSRIHRKWTHAVIIYTKESCIHCSYFYGGEVTITSFEEIYKKYDFAPSEKSEKAVSYF